MKSTSKITKGIFTILLGLTVIVFCQSSPARGDNALAASRPLANSSSTTPILYASSPHSTFEAGSLFSIDLTTGVATKIGDFGLLINGLAYDSDNDILYGVDGGFGASINHLFRINRETGVATPIGPLGSINFWGLAYDPTRHQLFATNQGGFDLGCPKTPLHEHFWCA